MTAAPPESDTFTELMASVFESYDNGVLYVLGQSAEALCERTPAAFKIDAGCIEVLEDVDIKIVRAGNVIHVVAETSDGTQYVGPSGCSCGAGHPVKVSRGDIATIKAGPFKCL